MADAKQISLSLLTFLRYEYLNYCISKSSELITDEKKGQHEQTANKISISGIQLCRKSLIRELVMSTLEESGFHLGIRLVERLSLFRNRLNDQKEIIKFVCKDLWNYIFLKQADRLKTNRRGGYAILDNNLSWLSNLPNSVDMSTREMQFEPAINVIIVCGIIRGALQHLGLTCSVAAEVSRLPSCTFQIRVFAPSK
ncbi:hypothetical protein FG386_003269 [Cryptosporidium ryanae]|uniref:uncharacterized protein n=1 Tax=Cryptosporidium ryanae TaxID=515981 RepID=UPI00351A6827|nr:hypothetical protein FG386_003269 [Cryptosporidium ryanae]